MKSNYDVVVIGSGPAGYVAALRCAQLKMSVACVEKWLDSEGKPRLGGTCLNVGCIPSKAMLESSHHYEFIKHESADHGILVKEAGLNIKKMLDRKTTIVKELTDGIDLLFEVNGIDWIQGKGKLLPNREVEVELLGSGKTQKLTAKNVILAAGSLPAPMDSAPFDHELICDSEDALSWKKIPKRLSVIGAGVIALEMGSVWRRLGAEVSLFHPSKTFLRNADQSMARLVKKTFLKQGLAIHSGHQVVQVKKLKTTVELTVVDGEKKEHKFVSDKLLVATGRSPVSTDIASPEVGLKVDERGRIDVDDHCQTNVPNVYAIGDCVRGDMLAHKGSEEGVMVAERIHGEKSSMNYDAVPFVIYTYPEIAWVGLTEEQAKAKGLPYRVGSFSVGSNGRAKSMGKSAVGICKLIAHAESDRVLGMHIFGPQASELVSIGVQAIETESASEDLVRTVFAHPTISEAVHESALDVLGRALHSMKKSR